MSSAPTGEEIAPERRADAAAPLAEPKRIVVFSDGTGNSSRALFRTNVYRLYDALDLGSRPGGPDQIAYYDNGVGTSSFRFLAVLGGIFGFGLKRNLLRLYEYVCRNYNGQYPGTDKGDTIYAFGFSRGAFTIRLLVALICTQGIVPYEDERELKRNCADAVRRFLGENAPDLFPWLFQTVRWFRDRIIQGWRRLRGQAFNREAESFPDIEFVGVWDTVAAYGGPIVEITRGIDQYVWPLTMTDYELHRRVKVARHALALDDERDSFWPLLWDEIADQRAHAGINKECRDWNAAERLRAGSRLKQVWFAGMHSDVGGGYPDDSLAYVSLKWMIDEINALGPDRLALIQSEEARIRAFANPLGPMHDSRSGLAGYYRYQPRKIAAMLHRSIADTVGMNQTRVLRDPIIGEKRHRPQGLLTACHVHRSVIERICLGNDNYAPIVLPRKFEIEPPYAPADKSALAAASRTLQERDRAKGRGEIQENAWDNVWLRRTCYFAVVLLTAFLALAPFWGDGSGFTPGMDSRWVLSDIFVLGRKFVPSWLLAWYDPWTANWALSLVILGLIGLIANAMRALEADLRDRVRIAWWDALAGQTLERFEPTALRALRNSLGYQAVMQFWKWRVLPFLFGVSILLCVPWLVLVLWTQTSLIGLERGVAFCKESAENDTPAAVLKTRSAPLALDPKNPCLPFAPLAAGRGQASPAIQSKAAVAAHGTVVKGQRYYVILTWPERGDPWRDKTHPVAAAGRNTFDFPFPANVVMAGGAPLRRVVLARWLEPLVEIRDPKPDLSPSGYRRTIMIQRLTPVAPVIKEADESDKGQRKPPAIRWMGSFVPTMSGTAWIFLNDAALPEGTGGATYFYANNKRTFDNSPSAGATLWKGPDFEQTARQCEAALGDFAKISECLRRKGIDLRPTATGDPG
ncbi:DUF2235 domain-containing protein [Novosphingobium lindaniclasticum]